MRGRKINHGAVWVTIVLAQLILWIWFGIYRGSPYYYHPDPTGLPVMEGTNILKYVLGFLGTVVAMYVLAFFFNRIPMDSGRDGAIAGLIIGVVFNFFSLFTIYHMSSHPLEIGMMDFGLNAIVFLMAGMVHGLWHNPDPEPNS